MSMTEKLTPGALLRATLSQEKPLQVAGVINAYAALLAESSGFRALYLSGAGVANASLGLPDLAMTTLTEVLEDLRRIVSATDLPVLVDVDTGWGHAFMIGRTIKEMCRAGAAGVHIEDQIAAKRCGHRPGKSLVSTEEMIQRLKAATDARIDPDFVIMARTDAVAVEGLDAAIERACRYREAGADMIFPEALGELSHYRSFAEQTGLPILANMTEFGATPLFNLAELATAGVSLALYPLSAFRAMSATALTVYQTIRKEWTQESVVHLMQSREELYEILRYKDYERKLDQLNKEEESP
jgi:methylisocitrate lyase